MGLWGADKGKPLWPRQTQIRKPSDLYDFYKASPAACALATLPSHRGPSLRQPCPVRGGLCTVPGPSRQDALVSLCWPLGPFPESNGGHGHGVLIGNSALQSRSESRSRSFSAGWGLARSLWRVCFPGMAGWAGFPCRPHKTPRTPEG